MIIKAIERAFKVMHERNWDRIYWAIDLHGVCLESNYQNGGYTFLNDEVIVGLKAISDHTESRIILWSSCHVHEQEEIIKFMAHHGIIVDWFNENPEVANTQTGDFETKFYFSVLLDDKAGFDPDTDWVPIINFMTVQNDIGA